MSVCNIYGDEKAYSSVYATITNPFIRLIGTSMAVRDIIDRYIKLGYDGDRTLRRSKFNDPSVRMVVHDNNAEGSPYILGKEELLPLADSVQMKRILGQVRQIISLHPVDRTYKPILPPAREAMALSPTLFSGDNKMKDIFNSVGNMEHSSIEPLRDILSNLLSGVSHREGVGILHRIYYNAKPLYVSDGPYIASMRSEVAKDRRDHDASIAVMEAVPGGLYVLRNSPRQQDEAVITRECG